MVSSYRALWCRRQSQGLSQCRIMCPTFYIVSSDFADYGRTKTIITQSLRPISMMRLACRHSVRPVRLIPKKPGQVIEALIFYHNLDDLETSDVAVLH